MQTLPNTSKASSVFDRIWAAFTFLTRLPFWRIYQPPKEAYKSVVEFWPLTGWFTGGLMALLMYLISPYSLILAVVFAVVVRLLVTGALHEDGLADFFDGFGGGGSDRNKILSIMKDSHIGTYGVLSIVLYVLLLVVCLFLFAGNSPKMTALLVFFADPFSKMLAGHMVALLPYARTEEESKAHNIYKKFSVGSYICFVLQGLLPLIPLLFYFWRIVFIVDSSWWIFIVVLGVPVLLLCALLWFIRKKIGGYTGDCCGAFCLLLELSVYVTFYLITASITTFLAI